MRLIIYFINCIFEQGKVKVQCVLCMNAIYQADIVILSIILNFRIRLRVKTIENFLLKFQNNAL